MHPTESYSVKIVLIGGIAMSLPPSIDILKSVNTSINIKIAPASFETLIKTLIQGLTKTTEKQQVDIALLKW